MTSSLLYPPDPSYRLRCLQCPTSLKYFHCPKTALLLCCQKFVAPGNGIPHRLLARWHVLAPPRKSARRLDSRSSTSVKESRRTCIAANSMARGGDRPAHKWGNSRSLVGSSWSDCLGAITEERDRIVEWEGNQRKYVFRTHTQGCAARYQNTQMRTTSRPPAEMPAPPPECVRNYRVQKGTACAARRSELARPSAYLPARAGPAPEQVPLAEERGISDGSQGDEGHAIGEARPRDPQPVAWRVGSCPRHWGPGNSQETCRSRAQASHCKRAFLFASNQRSRRMREAIDV